MIYRPSGLYVIGLLVWVAIWAGLFGGVELGWFSAKTLVDSRDRWWFLVPALVGAASFIANIWLWKGGGACGGHDAEVALMRALETNASWFLVANGAFLGGGSFFFTTVPEHVDSSPFVYSFMTFVSFSIFATLPVITLWWLPTQADPISLARLRHYKTIWFHCSAGFLAAATLALLLSLQVLS